MALKELITAGQISKLPKIYGVQSANCAPYYAAYLGSTESILPQVTIADGIASHKPVRLAENLAAMHASEGACLAVSEEEIRQAYQALRQRGFYTEPTSAVTVAAFIKLCNQQKIASEDKVVLVLTGSGLKTTSNMPAILEQESCL